MPVSKTSSPCGTRHRFCQRTILDDSLQEVTAGRVLHDKAGDAFVDALETVQKLADTLVIQLPQKRGLDEHVSQEREDKTVMTTKYPHASQHIPPIEQPSYTQDTSPSAYLSLSRTWTFLSLSLTHS